MIARLALLAVLAAVVLAAPPHDARTAPPTLQQQKLQQEIEKLKHENANNRGFRGFVAAYAGIAGVFTAGAAVLGVLFTFRGQRKEQARQAKLDRQQRKNDREQREVESRRRLDERFSSNVADLGSKEEAVQAAAAVSLLTFLRPENADFHRQVRLVTLANLKVPHTAVVTKLLVRVFEAAVRTPDPLDPIELDLSDAKLARANLSELKLEGADLSRADLHSADLTNTDLKEARGTTPILTHARLCGERTDLRQVRWRSAEASRANFCEANLVKAHLEGSDLSDAQFQRAHLQSAHLDDTNLKGARFEEADLNDTYFRSAELDEKAMRSIVRALNWKKAHFSPGVIETLRSLDGKGGSDKEPPPTP
jgi:uncharacterized protein YjbI with pentapeptide repeats